MPTRPLPDRPDLEHLKGTAKALRDLVRAGAPGAIDLAREHHPRLGGLTAGSAEAARFRLADAQLTLARHHGFASWPRLRHHVELVNELTRSPHAQPVGGPLDDDDARADELVRLACLNYGDDRPDRRTDAARLLAAHPELSGHSIHTAAVTGDVAVATWILAADPAVASTLGGPYRWAPLLSLTYSRLPGDRPGHDAVAVARLLLDHGADPDAGYLWDGLPSPFTALTGVFGGGEQGAPPHRDELALARLLLDAGADANDSQTIYDRGLGDQPHDDTAFLELLLDHGLGRGDGGPWHRALGDAHQTPAEIAAEALQFAAEAGLVARAGLLLAHGVDPDTPGTHPLYHGRTPYVGAIVHGNLDIAALLAAAGADTTGVSPFERAVGELLAADRAIAAGAIAADPGLLPRVRLERPELARLAAGLGRHGAVRDLVAAGFDVDERAGSGGATALHEAAFRGDVATVRLLLELGADPTLTDDRFHATPRGWAEHNGQDAVVAVSTPGDGRSTTR